MLKKVLIIILFMAGVFLLIAALLPSQYRVERTVMIQAPDSLVYEQIANYEHWLSWSAWALRDQDASNDFMGEAATLGHKWSWKGEIVGEGSMTHVELVPNKRVVSELAFLQPQAMTATNIMEINPTPTGTRVSMAIEGSLGYPVERIFGLAMDDLVGPDFEEGLNNLKNKMEGGQ
jgi:hypothetical protein